LTDLAHKSITFTQTLFALNATFENRLCRLIKELSTSISPI
jgi:hypothetical protein